MKTTQGKAVDAYKALNELMDMDGLNILDAWYLSRLRKEMDFIIEFQITEEQKLIDQYHPKVNDGKCTFEWMPTGDEEKDHLLKVEVEERAAQFNRKMKEIRDTPIEFEIHRVGIPAERAMNLSLKPNLLYRLSGYVAIILPTEEESAT